MKRYKYPALLILISLFIHHSWITHLAPLAHGDTIYFTQSSLRDFFSPLSLWVSSYLTTGALYITASYYPMFFVTGLLSVFGFNYEAIIRIVYMWPLLIVIPIGSYALVKYVIKSEAAGVAGSFVFSYNTYTLIRNTDQLPITVAFSLTPVILLFFIRAVVERRLYLAVLAGYFLLFSSFFDFRIAYVTAGILILFLAFSVFTTPGGKLPRLRASLPYLIPLGILLGGNMYWFISVAATNQLTSNALFDRGLFGNDFFNILYSITLHHPFWTGSAPSSFVVQPIPPHYFLIPIIAFLGFFIGRTNKLVLFFTGLSLVGIFLSKQVSDPFPLAYEWLFTHIPGFNAFREASKFYFITAIGYSVLIGVWCDRIVKYGIIGKVMYGLVCVLFLFNAAPLVNGHIGTLFIPRTIHRDYQSLNTYIDRQPEYFRTLWIPHTSRWGTFSQQHPMLSFDVMMQQQWRDISGYKNLEYYAPGSLMLETFKNPSFNQILDMTSIKYVIVPLQDVENDDDFISLYKTARKDYVNALSQVPYLRRRADISSHVAVFENANYRPKLYLTTQPERTNTTQDAAEPTILSSSPTHYVVRINPRTRTYLTLAQTYDKGWRVAPHAPHSKNIAGFNTFELSNVSSDSPQIITLSYTPQNYVLWGTLTSLSTILGAALLFYYDFRNHHGNRKKGTK